MRFDLKKLFTSNERTADSYLFCSWDVITGRVRPVRNAQGETEYRRWKQSKRLRRLIERPVCGARCRDGHQCRRRAVPDKRRCPNHGGLSTGPRTAEGRQRIAESNKRRALKTDT